MMKKTMLIFIAFVLCFALNVFAADNVSNSTTARVYQVISVSNTQDLDFGSILPSASTATLVVAAADGSGTYTNCTAVNGDDPHEAIFLVSGQANTAYTVNLPTSIVIESGANSMTVNSFTADRNASLDGDGLDYLRVGATLNIDASQNAGEYTGTFSVTVSYQ